ncbi:unnamed protein product, partial [Diabrotica balteata]
MTHYKYIMQRLERGSEFDSLKSTRTDLTCSVNIVHINFHSNTLIHQSLKFATALQVDATSVNATQAIALLKAGLRQRAVVNRLNLSQSAVSRVYRRYQDTADYIRRQGGCRKR